MTKDSITVDEHEPADASIVAEEDFTDEDLELHDPAEALADLDAGKLSKFPTPDEPADGDGALAGAASDQAKVPAFQKQAARPHAEVIPPTGFDYTQLSVETRKILQEVSVSVIRRMTNVQDELLGIGGDLLRAKEACERGEWVPWYRFEIQPFCNFDLRTAQMYMRAFKTFGATSPFGDAVPLTGLVALAGEPEEVLDEVAKLAKAKGKVTVTQIREIKARHEPKQTGPKSAALAEFASEDGIDGAKGALTQKAGSDRLLRELKEAVGRRAALAVEEIMQGYGAFYQAAHTRLTEAAEKEAKGHANPLAKKTAAEIGSEAAKLREALRTYAGFDDGNDNGEGMWKDIERALYTLEGFRHVGQSTGSPDVGKIAAAVRQLPAPAKSWMPNGGAA